MWEHSWNRSVLVICWFNPSSPKICIQILQNWSRDISLKNNVREFDKQSEDLFLTSSRIFVGKAQESGEKQAYFSLLESIHMWLG